jgi:hypothetical protein
MQKEASLININSSYHIISSNVTCSRRDRAENYLFVIKQQSFTLLIYVHNSSDNTPHFVRNILITSLFIRIVI